MRRFPAFAVAMCLVLGACSSPMSLTEYAQEVERLVATMNERIDEGEAVVDADPTLEQAQAYATDRVDARHDFLNAFGALNPPEEAVDLHATALDIVTRLTAAEAGLADLVMEAESFEEASAIWTTPQGEAFQIIDDEALALCAAAQAGLDATQQRDAFTDTPWIPPEMREVVEVTFRCDREDR